MVFLRFPVRFRYPLGGNLIGLLVLLFFAVFSAGADVKLPALIGDNMVLQRGAVVTIWGTAEPGEKVAVTMGDLKLSTEGDMEGRWMVRFTPPDAAGPFEMDITGNNTITLHNILVGEVWVCSGQSNMQWSVSSSANAEQEISQADYPMIRLFSVKRVVADKPMRDTEGSWVICSPETVKSFSAVGYFFGRDLHKELNIPVGLIHSSWGGTPAEAWTSLPALEAVPQFKPILDRWAKILEEYPKAEEEYKQKMAQWEEEAKKAREEGKPEPAKPQPPVGPSHPHRPAGLYNGMIAPLVPFAIKGAIWYQGESNAGRAYQYRELFPTMINDWRNSWRQGDFPFLFVQLANFQASPPPPSDSAWAELREAQMMTLSLPKTGMAVAIDVGEASDIHPKNKQDVGHRLALAAANVAYDRDAIYSGPIYEYMTVEVDKIRLHFKHVNGGLVAKGGSQLSGFAIAGEDRRFVWARTRIEGETVVVWSENVPQPAAARYAWGDNPDCNLYNTMGLPASPFRTDNWPGITVKSQ